MPSYDAAGTPYQIGTDLQVYSSGGFATTEWDKNGASFDSLVDLCMHRGVLYAAWVEPELVSGVRVARGPFVKFWNGATWIAVGGEVEAVVYPAGAIGGSEPVVPAGSRFHPGAPRLVSDGTDLFCVYTIHVDVGGDGSWSPVHVAVSRFDGTSWVVHGEVAAITNNTTTPPGSGPAGYQLFGVYAGHVSASASPLEPGVVYVCFFEAGMTAANHGAAPWTVGGYIESLRAVQVTASTVTAKDVVRYEVVGPTSEAAWAAFSTAEENGLHAQDHGVQGCEIANDSSYGAIIFKQSSAPLDITIPEGLQVIRFSDLAVVQEALEGDPTFPLGGGDTDLRPRNVIHDPDASTYYISSSTSPTAGSIGAVLEIFDDVLAKPQILDGIVGNGDAIGPLGPFFDFIASGRALVADGAAGLWMPSITTNRTPPRGRIIHYHRECRGWSDLGPGFPDLTLTQHRDAAMARIGDTLYMVAPYYDASNLSADVRFIVTAIPILRNVLSCGGGSNGLHIDDVVGMR